MNENEIIEDMQTEPVTEPLTEPLTEPQTEPETEPETNAYESIISEQGKQIEALIRQNENLTAQITKMIESGTQITDGKPLRTEKVIGGFAQNNHDDVSLSDLGKMIGKRDENE